MYRSIMVPVDLAEAELAQPAIAAAVSFAKISGGMLLIMGVGLAIGPAIAPVLMNNFKPVGMFIVTAAFHGALAVSTLFRMRARPNRHARRRGFWEQLAPDYGRVARRLAGAGF